MANDNAAASVLVAGDAGAERELLATILREAGYNVVTVGTGAQALERAQAGPTADQARPDVVVAAPVMPVMDGYELVRELRAEPATAAIPVVFATSDHLGPEARDLATACGVTRILTIPQEPAQIRAAVAKALDRTKDPPAPLPADEFHRRHLRMLNARLLAKVDELRETALLASALHREVAAALARSGSDTGLDKLSPREKEVLTMLGDGCSNREIADQLEIATSTVQSHVKKILHKLGAKNRTEAAVRYTKG